MAEFFWANKLRVAASTLLATLALLALLDRVTRPDISSSAATAMTLLVVGLAGAAVACAALPFDHFRPRWAMAPAIGSVVAVIVAVALGDLASSPSAGVGLAVMIFVLFSYLGFVLQPGLALVAAPIMIFVVLAARESNRDDISLALPLLAVPMAALLAELIASLAARGARTDLRDNRRMVKLARLEDVLRRFRRPGSLQQAGDQVAVAAREIFDVDRATVVLRDSRGELLSTTIGPTSDRTPEADVARVVAETIAGEEPRLVPTGSNGTMLVLPLPAAEAPAGVVLVYPVPADDPDFTLDLARLFGVQVGIAIEHLFVIDELARANTRDELTGIGNRRHADALVRSLQPGDALVLLDLDGFKAVNDTHGHPAGDRVLQALSAHLRHCLRDSDTSARLGGDEFLIVARRAHADPLAVANRVLEGWAERGGNTTLSAGVALHDREHTSDMTFEHADRALYQAKAKGKNRAQLWRPVSEAPSVDAG